MMIKIQRKIQSKQKKKTKINKLMRRKKTIKTKKQIKINKVKLKIKVKENQRKIKVKKFKVLESLHFLKKRRKLTMILKTTAQSNFNLLIIFL